MKFLRQLTFLDKRFIYLSLGGSGSGEGAGGGWTGDSGAGVGPHKLLQLEAERR